MLSTTSSHLKNQDIWNANFCWIRNLIYMSMNWKFLLFYYWKENNFHHHSAFFSPSFSVFCCNRKFIHWADSFSFKIRAFVPVPIKLWSVFLNWLFNVHDVMNILHAEGNFLNLSNEEKKQVLYLVERFLSLISKLASLLLNLLKILEVTFELKTVLLTLPFII